jgi:very-short-patch-repair endonuclease
LISPGSSTRGRAERAVDNCLAAETVSFHALRGTFYKLASRGRAGTACVRKILEDRGPQYIPPASELEREFFTILAAAGLPKPVRQLDVGDEQDWIGRVDLAYPESKVIVEIDSDRHHTSKLDRQADAERDRRLIAAGWCVVRVTEEDLRRGAPKALAQLRQRLA